MRINLLFAGLALLPGCRSVPTTSPLPDIPPAIDVNRVAQDKTADAERPVANDLDAERLRWQSQVIEALTAQNDALSSRLTKAELKPAAVPLPPTPIPPVAPLVRAPAAQKPGSAEPTARPDDPEERSIPAGSVRMLVPNAAGVIDTTALESAGNPNPFAVRVAADSAREITLQVQGIFTGNPSCALVNGRIAQVGDLVESLRLDRIDPTGLVLNGDDFAVTLPLGATKVRLAL